MQHQPKFIFVTGGVCSGLGKGIAASSIGAILRAQGYSVFCLKLDPYLNVDPGTMSPYQHGEVFVTDDGAETDLDLGHYERFIDTPLSKLSSLTSGQIYQNIINDEREGRYLGNTVQIVPHVTDRIKRRIDEAQKQSGADVVIVEIGGTVGDIEGQPYLEAARQFHHEKNGQNTIFVHLTLLPYLGTSGELKTKPTQASVRELQSHGIQPGILMLRADLHIPENLLKKISLFCDVERAAVIPAPTLETIYEVPISFAKYGLAEVLARKLDLPLKKFDLSGWKKIVRVLEGKATKRVKIAMAGKYNENHDAYISVSEALKAAGAAQNAVTDIVWIDTEKLEKKDKKELSLLKSCDGIVVPGGFGNRGTEGKIAAINHAIDAGVPYFGLCLGMQLAAVAIARRGTGNQAFTSEEFDAKSEFKIIHYMPGQHDELRKGGTMRLGSYPCVLQKDTNSHKAYGSLKIDERHRHRYEVNNDFLDVLRDAGAVIAGKSPDGTLVEVLELKKHPWFVGVQFHPELKSRPLRPHPLFMGFVKAALARSKRK